MTSGETMESQEFIVLYTHQKMKKSKMWQDGILKVTRLGNKAILYDDKGKCLDSLFLKCLEVKPGDDLESDQYLITVEEVKGAGSTAVKPDVIKEAPESSARGFVPSGRCRGRQPAGLKRKFTGFQGPRQVPQKMVIMENGESAVSMEAQKPGPVFLSSFYDTSPLFSTAGKKDINDVPTDAESTVMYRNGERNGSALSFKINPETLCEENRFCSPVSSVNTHSRSSLTIEPTKRESLASHCFGVSQNIRSKAQIAALLKSKSASVSEEASSEIVEHFPQGQSQGSCKIATQPKCLIEQEECAEVRTGGLRYPRQSESTTKNRSWWAGCSSSQSAPVHSTAGGNDLERKPMAQGDNMNLNLKDLLIQKRVQFFEICAENGKMYDEDKLVVNNQSWDQEVKLEITSFCESSTLPVTRGSVQNDELLSEPDIQENIKIPVNQNDQICVKESILTRENAQGIHLCGTPGQECKQTVSYLSGPEHLQTESSLSNSSRMPDAVTDMFSETNTDDERLTSVHEPMSDVTQPVLEVTFNINNFETSDTEEESQESNRISQDSECWVKETLVNDCSPGVQKRCENVGCEEVGCEHLPLLPSIGGKATETCPIRETLSSQFCGQTCVGFDTRSWKVGTTGGEIEEVDSSCHSSSPCTGDAANEGADRSLQNVRINYDFASLPNKSKGINANLHVPHFLNMTTNQTPVNSLFSEQAQPQPFIMGSDLAKNDQVLPTTSGSDSSTQLLNASPSHSEEGIALDPSHPQVSKSLSCPLGRKHPIFKDTAAHIPECEDVGGIISLPRDHTGVDAAGDSRQPWTSPRDSSEPSGLVNNISLLKSLSEHSTALEGWEILKKKNTTLKQQGALRTREPGGSPEAEKPWVSAASQARPMSPHPNQHSQQCSTPTMIKENEVEPGEPLQSLQVFSLGSEEERVFPALIPKQIEREACAPKPVEFQGHQVKGSASSAVMVRAHSSRLQCRPLPGSVEYESCTTDTRVPAPKLPCTGMQVDFPQVTSPEQKMSTLSPFSTFSLDSRDDDFVLEFFERPLRARTLPVMKKFSSVENKNFQRPPLVRRTRLPLVPGSPDLDATGCDRQEASGSPTSCLCDDAAVPSFSFGPEDQRETSLSKGSREVTPGHVALLHNVSSQSKWLKYQNTPQCNLTAPGRVGRKITDSFLVESTSGMCFSDTGERQGHAVKESSVDAVRLQLIEDTLRQQQQEFSTQGLVCRKQALSKPEEIPNVLGEPAGCKYSITGDSQGINGSELCFPSGQKIKSAYLPQRQTHVPAVFQSPAHYKQIFTSCLIEHLNILLFGLAQRLQKALSEVDISFYTSSKGEKLKNVENKVPSCHHHQPAKLVMVKKEGPNKGRLFYTCDASKSDQCKFFKWLEEVTPGNLKQKESPPCMVLSDIKSIGLYLRSQNIPLYEECQLLVRKGFDFQRKQYGKLKKFTTVNPEFYNEPKSKLYLKLSRKESSSTYSKDDLWVVSKTLDFELDTFIACSAFFGPSSTNEVELLPLQGYFPSNWPTNTVVHALLVCNASTELTTLKNIEDHFNPATLPLTRSLLAMSSSTTVSNKRVDKRKFIPPAFSNMNTKLEVLSLGATLQVASELIQAHTLNKDQATALTQIAQMMASPDSAEEVSGPHTPVPPITVIQGVFGAGKSHLLAVVILFFVQLFEKSEAPAVGSSRPWKLLVSSSTNVAVDRVLLGLLSLGFEKFVRVGSVRKIAKPVLPYSLHAGSENENEQLKELHALMKEDLTPVEKVYVRKSIEQHKLGTNKTLLKQVRVVGVTCAACPFPCLNDLTFPVVVLDESSQITEPASLLPIARFGCEKLILVGDPKQLPPTIQGSEAAHESGLEQTLFDRLRLMGHKPILLRTQYRCHPAISAVANDLFYDGNLTDGVSALERGPLLDWLPTLCFYNVQGVEQVERGNSFHNVAEAAFTLKLIQSLIASGVAGSVVGVITLYRSQMHKLRDSLQAVAFDQPDVRAVQVSTVDAFQGAEKEIIILSCVRTRQVGFIDSEKRMNVALTRGRRHLLIVGNLACLRKNRLWGRVLQHCEGRKDGLQHASQCETQLNHLLTDYFEKQAEEKQKKKSEKDKSEDKSHLQKGMV